MDSRRGPFQPPETQSRSNVCESLVKDSSLSPQRGKEKKREKETCQNPLSFHDERERKKKKKKTKGRDNTLKDLGKRPDGSFAPPTERLIQALGPTSKASITRPKEEQDHQLLASSTSLHPYGVCLGSRQRTRSFVSIGHRIGLRLVH